MSKIIDGKSLALGIREKIKKDIVDSINQGRRAPCLAVVLVGKDPASEIYVHHKQQTCMAIGISSKVHKLPENISQVELISLLHDLNRDEGIDGILLQLPLPKHLDRVACVSEISPHKDVDGITPINEGYLVWRYPGLYPCTPLGIMELIKSVEPDLSGKVAAVVGRSALVGMPIGTMLEGAGCSIIGLHSESKNPSQWTSQADIVVVATGVKHLVDDTWIKEGAVVIDVGIHRDGSKLTGDVQFDKVYPKARAISPVPGGVGPMTIAMLLKNCYAAYMKTFK